MSTQWKTVHVFISSTFNDMHAERDYLVKRVFPELRDWCERRKLQLIDIDLRWGVTEQDAVYNKNVVRVCLNRINDCRPFFVCFLGQRRGWVPSAHEISDETFHEFPELGNVSGTASITEMEILHALFRPLHGNVHHEPEKPPEYYEKVKYALFYIRDSSYLKDLPANPLQLRQIYTNEWIDDPKEREQHDQALKQWSEKLIPESGGNVRRYLARWNSESITPELMFPLQCPSLYSVNIDRWRREWRKAGIQIDASSTNIEEDPLLAQEAANFNRRLSSGRLVDFRVGDQELREIILEDLKLAIQDRFPAHIEVEQENELLRELDQHENFLVTNVRDFIERPNDFQDFFAYVESDSRQLFALTGQGGLGKSTLLASWVDRYRKRALKNTTIHFRFIGQSDSSTTVHDLLYSLLLELRDVSAKIPKTDIPKEPAKLRHAWNESLKTLGSAGKTIIVVDGLNQLETGLRDVYWIPRRLPENVKFIVSFRQDDPDGQAFFEQLKEHAHISFMKAFVDPEDRRQLLKKYLWQYLKELDDKHLEAIVQLPAAQNPLYLKVLLSELRVFGAFAGLSEKIQKDFGESPETAFQGVLKRLETDPAYSPISTKESVPLLFGLLSHARRGLTATELGELLLSNLGMQKNKNTREMAADTIHMLLRQVRPFVSVRDGRYDYFYESFKLAAIQRYSKEDPGDAEKRSTQEWHTLLSDYFYHLPTWDEERRPCIRKVSELPYHSTLALDWIRVKETLSDLDFVEAKCTAGLVYELLPDYQRAIDQSKNAGVILGPVSEYFQFVRNRAHLLSLHPQLTFQEASNFVEGSVASLDAMERFKNGKETRSFFRRLNRESGELMESPIRRFLRHDSSVYGCSVSFDGKTIASAGWDGLRVWDCATGQQLDPDPVLSAHLGYVAFTPEGLWISHWDGMNRFGELELLQEKTFLPLKRFKIPDESPGDVVVTRDGKLLAYSMQDEVVILDIPADRKRVRLKEVAGQNVSLSFSADGRFLAAVTREGNICGWDTSTWQVVWRTKDNDLNGMPADLRSCSLSPDGSMISLVRRDGVICMQVGTWRPLAILRGHSRAIEQCIHANHHEILTCSRDGVILVWQISNASSKLNLPPEFLDWTTKESAYTSVKWHSRAIPCCAFSPDGLKAAIVHAGKHIGIYDAQDLRLSVELEQLSAHRSSQGHVPSVCTFSPDGSSLLCGEKTGKIVLYDVRNSNEPVSFPQFLSYEVTSCSFSKDGTRFLCSSEDRTMQLWDIATRKLVSAREAHSGIIRQCCFSPDGSSIVSVSDDHTIKIWGSTTLKPIGVWRDDPVPMRCCSFSANGSIFATGSAEGTLSLWNFKTGKLIKKLRPCQIAINYCWWMPGDQFVIAAFQDGSLRIVEIQTEKIVSMFHAESELMSAACTTDGRRFLLSTKNNSFSFLRLENWQIP